MATYIMFGKYSSDALKGINSKRTVKGNALVNKLGGKVISLYAMLGDKDLLLIADFPSMEQAMKASIGLSKLTGIVFSTAPAVTVEEFDKIMTKV